MPYGRNSAIQAQYNNQQLKGTLAITADTYTEEQILMPQCPEGILPGFLRITIQQDKTKLLDAAADYMGFHISPKSQTALLKIGDPDCIAAKLLESKGIGLETQDHQITYEFPAPQLISYKLLYIGLYGKLAQTIDYQIDWVPRQSAVPQRDNLVSQAQF